MLISESEKTELYRRLQQARNLKKLLLAKDQKINVLGKTVELLKQSRKEEGETIRLQKKMIELQALRIEYLEKIVFGKGKKKRDQDFTYPPSMFSSKKKEKKTREKKSYQREIPQKEEITETNTYDLACCPDCQGELTEKRTVERYEEDIVLPEETKNPLKRILKQRIETGWCRHCKTRKSKKPINGSKVVLGGNTKIMTVYLSIVMRLSYEQIQNMMRDIWHLKLSDGEIKNILEEQGNRLIHAHEAIAKSLLNQAAHYDETGWKTVKGAKGNYAWIKTGTKTTDTLFLLGKSRGKGNAQILCQESSFTGITDDYPGYDGVFSSQALCWSHPNRKLRDLSESQTLKGRTKKACQKTFEAFQKLYKDLNGFEGTFEQRKARKGEYVKRYRAIACETRSDPEKLKTYKKTLRKEEAKYFTFIDIEGIPMDNNQAERRLRHLVLKRKISFGSKTQKGAEMLEKLFSVVLTFWWRDPKHFIANYRHLLA
jgi:transposase